MLLSCWESWESNKCAQEKSSLMVSFGYLEGSVTLVLLNSFGAPNVQVFEKRKGSPSQRLNHPAIISSITFQVNVSLTSMSLG